MSHHNPFGLGNLFSTCLGLASTIAVLGHEQTGIPPDSL